MYPRTSIPKAGSGTTCESIVSSLAAVKLRKRHPVDFYLVQRFSSPIFRLKTKTSIQTFTVDKRSILSGTNIASRVRADAVESQETVMNLQDIPASPAEQTDPEKVRGLSEELERVLEYRYGAFSNWKSA
jgi:hypothetical protein